MTEETDYTIGDVTFLGVTQEMFEFVMEFAFVDYAGLAPREDLLAGFMQEERQIPGAIRAAYERWMNSDEAWDAFHRSHALRRLEERKADFPQS